MWFRGAAARVVGGLSTVVVLVLVAAACGSNAGSGGSSSSGAGASGKVVVSGSSTVQPISSLAAQEFSQQNQGISISVDGPGTTDGFALFCKGETDVQDASRPIKDEEKTACEGAGVNYIELPIAYDGITVMTNPANTAVNCLSKADLYALIGPESQGFAKWSDADSLDKQLGGTGNFPDVPLDITAPGTESGTYDAFIELALKDIAADRSQEEANTRPDYQSSANDNVIIQGIEGSDSSLGWVGFAYAEENASGVKILAVDPATDASGEGSPNCVTPTRETIADASYPLSRTLYLYINADKAKSNAATVKYIDYYLANLANLVQKAGYVDFPAAKIQQTVQTWDSAKPGASS
jgi:phosphate transport system substrate-binding protein